MTTIATIARETDSQPHEIAALLDLGTDYADDQDLTGEQIAIVITSTLNAYDGDNVWQDVILGLSDYDDEATDAIDEGGSSDRLALSDGTIIVYAHERGEWVIDR